MTLLAQYPALLGLLALAGLPVLVHLLSRARPPEYRFSNIEFLRRVIRRTARIRRPQDWLLLALRTLALAALAAAFISPVLISKSAALPGEKSTVVIMIDRSASMAARDGAGSRFETACAEAIKYLDDARPDAANLIWIDAEPAAAFPEPGPNTTYLTDQLKTAEPRPEPGALTAAFDLALRQFAKIQGRGELIVISDFQASAWRDFQPALPPDIDVRTHRVATAAPPNLAVVRLLSQPAEPIIGQDTTLLASVRNFSPDAVHTELTLDADGSRQTQSIDLPPWGETETAFPLRPANSGPLPLTASIEPDSFPGDDARHSVLRVRDAIRIANPQTDPVIDKVIAALPWLQTTANPQPGDVLVRSTWDGSESPRIAAGRGVTILIHDPFSLPAALLTDLTGAPASVETSTTGWQVLPNEQHPAIQLFRNGDFGNPFAGTFRERLRLPADLAESPGFKTIATYADGVPAIFEINTDQAPILFLNLPLNPEKSDWATHGSFLPAFAEILLRTRPHSVSEATQSLPGSRLSHVSTDPSQSGAFILLGPDSTPLDTRESTTSEGSLWQSLDALGPGLYRWQISGQTIDLTAVNFPDSESDLRPLDEAPTFGKRATSGDSLARHAALSRGVPLWPWLALATLGCLLLESLIHLRQPRPTIA